MNTFAKRYKNTAAIIQNVIDTKLGNKRFSSPKILYRQEGSVSTIGGSRGGGLEASASSLIVLGTDPGVDS